jgi:hypothetical protein
MQGVLEVGGVERLRVFMVASGWWRRARVWTPGGARLPGAAASGAREESLAAHDAIAGLG